MSQDQISNNKYKEWLDASIREGSIYCCPESDLVIDPIHIGEGGFGIVHKATVKNFGIITKKILNKKRNVLSGMTVAVKTLFPNKHNCKEDLYRELVQEVDICYYTHYSCIYCMYTNC